MDISIGDIVEWVVDGRQHTVTDIREGVEWPVPSQKNRTMPDYVELDGDIQVHPSKVRRLARQAAARLRHG
jgi:hypothetical protein